jgi:hypothetical protein
LPYWNIFFLALFGTGIYLFSGFCARDFWEGWGNGEEGDQKVS